MPRSIPKLLMRVWKLDCGNTFRSSVAMEFVGACMQELQHLIFGSAVLFKGIPSRSIELCKDVIDGYAVDIQVELKPGHDNVNQMVTDGWDTADSLCYASLAASTLQSINVEHESLVV